MKKPAPFPRSRFLEWCASLFLILLLSGLIFSCGDGGGNDVDAISGTASDGAPIAGEVYVRDAEGATRSTLIEPNGAFSLDADALIRPYLIWVEAADTGQRFYGAADSQGRANMTPVGHAAVAMALGIDPVLYYETLPDAPPPPSDAVEAAARRLTEVLSPVFRDLDIPTDFDFLHDPFAADGAGFDRLMALTAVSVADPRLQLRNAVSGVPFFTYNLLTGAVGGWETDARRRIILETDCDIDFQNWYVHTMMEEVYLWKDEMPDVDPEDYDSPADLLHDMIVPGKDRFSFIGPADEVGLFLEEGVYLGVGIKILTDMGERRIGLVYPGSPADAAGLQRGDRITAVNGRDASTPDIMSDELDFTEPGQTARLTIESQTGDIWDATLAAEWVTTHPVFYHDILELPGRRVGYLVFNDFLLTAMDDLDAAFADFKAGGINDLILDLRYNPGGSPDAAVRIAGWITGDNVDGNDAFAHMIHNEGYAEADRTIFFEPNPESLALDRVAIITGSQTASASEMLINGLAPYMEVILVGDTTYGKPVGMYVYDLCDKIFLPVAFQMVNALGEGAFFDGIPPDCPAVDDLDHALGDPQEASLSAALYYLSNGSCPPGGPTARIKTPFVQPAAQLTGFRRLIGAF